MKTLFGNENCFVGATRLGSISHWWLSPPSLNGTPTSDILYLPSKDKCASSGERKLVALWGEESCVSSKVAYFDVFC